MAAEPTVVFLSTSAALWGAEYSLLQIAHGLAEHGIRVEIWAQSDELLRLWEGPGRKVELGLRARVKNCRLLRLLRQLPAASIVVSFDISLAPGFALARPYLARRRIRTALDVHVDGGMGGRRRAIALAARWTDVCICVSDFMADQFGPQVPTSVVWRPIAPRCLAVEPDAFTVGIIGRVDPVKKIEVALAACAAAESRPYVVLRGGTFAGGQDYLTSIQRRGEQLLGDRFRYEGKVPQSVALDGLDVLLHGNDGEPSGRVVAEAQAAGVVPVVPDAGGAPEFVEHQVTGMVFTAGAASSAATCIDALANDKFRAMLSGHARRHADTRYDVTRQSAAYARALGVLD